MGDVFSQEEITQAASAYFAAGAYQAPDVAKSCQQVLLSEKGLDFVRQLARGLEAATHPSEPNFRHLNEIRRFKVRLLEEARVYNNLDFAVDRYWKRLEELT
jgi:hypothetical protein